MLDIRDLKKDYGSFKLDCTMSLPAGRITGLVGRNGSGKTTTFKAALGLIRPDGGSISILGKEPLKLSAADREQIGTVLSDSFFCGYLNAMDIAAILSNMYHGFDRNFFMDRLSEYELPKKAQIRRYSTGMLARLKLLCAISHGPKLLILDEPAAGLDVIARDELLTALRTFMEEDESRSILISSHISGDLEGVCDDIYMIHEGRIVFHEDTDVLLSDYGILKLSPEQFETIDKSYILLKKSEPYGFSCLTNEKRFYMENYPDITVENGSIDEIIFMNVKGERL